MLVTLITADLFFIMFVTVSSDPVPLPNTSIMGEFIKTPPLVLLSYPVPPFTIVTSSSRTFLKELLIFKTAFLPRGLNLILILQIFADSGRMI